MLKWEEIFMIKQLKNQGMSLKDIAYAVDRDVKTIRKYIKANKLPDYKRSSTKPSKLEAFKEYILKRMLKDGCTNSVLIFEEICEKGYKGKLTILRDFMKPYRKSALWTSSALKLHPENRLRLTGESSEQNIVARQ
jgi:transposase